MQGWFRPGKDVSALSCRKVFSAGASHYGVADCELLAKETHKFESRYLDSLIGCEEAIPPNSVAHVTCLISNIAQGNILNGPSPDQYVRVGWNRPYPQDVAVYKERSPINSLDSWSTPTAFFQASYPPLS